MSIDSKYLPDCQGFQVRAYLEYDSDSSPDECDCYTDADITAWLDNEWFYVTLVVEALSNDYVVGRASIGGMEYDLNGDCDYAWSEDYYLPDLIAEACEEAKLTASSKPQA